MKTAQAVETRYIDASHLISDPRDNKIHDSLVMICKEITDALKLFPEAGHLSIRYRNVLDSDMNPNGQTIHFRIVNDEDRGEDTLMPSPRYVARIESDRQSS